MQGLQDKYLDSNAPINASIMQAYRLLVEDSNPIIKRKVFQIKNGVVSFPQVEGDLLIEIVKFIRMNSNYDVNLIKNNLVRTGLVSFKYPRWLDKNFFKVIVFFALSLLPVKKRKHYRARFQSMIKNLSYIYSKEKFEKLFE